MLQNPVIKLLEGFCTLPFGSDKESATKLFGQPQKIQNLKEEILDTNSLVYHYSGKAYSLFFDANKNETFYSVEVENKDALLFDIKLFILKEKELIELLKKHGFSLSDTEKETWGEKRLSFDSAGLDCYFENQRLISVTFGILENG